jgi:flagellin
LSGIDLSTRSGTTDELDTFDSAIETVETDLAAFGATINRLTCAIDNLTKISQNAQASRSRIMDTDYAQATTDMARSQIIQQAARAMVAQENQAPQAVLSLFR